MSEQENRVRTVVMTYFPMFIATLSLCTSIYNGYLNNKFVDFIQRNLGRAEYLHTCKEILEAHAQIHFRAKLLNQLGDRTDGSSAQVSAQTEATNALIRFTSLATYLANLQTEARTRYTEVADGLEKIVNDAPRLSRAELDKRLERNNQLFIGMNDDCVRIAKQ